MKIKLLDTVEPKQQEKYSLQNKSYISIFSVMVQNSWFYLFTILTSAPLLINFFANFLFSTTAEMCNGVFP